MRWTEEDMDAWLHVGMRLGWRQNFVLEDLSLLCDRRDAGLMSYAQQLNTMLSVKRTEDNTTIDLRGCEWDAQRLRVDDWHIGLQ